MLLVTSKARQSSQDGQPMIEEKLSPLMPLFSTDSARNINLKTMESGRAGSKLLTVKRTSLLNLSRSSHLSRRCSLLKSSDQTELRVLLFNLCARLLASPTSLVAHSVSRTCTVVKDQRTLLFSLLLPQVLIPQRSLKSLQRMKLVETTSSNCLWVVAKMNLLFRC